VLSLLGAALLGASLVLSAVGVSCGPPDDLMENATELQERAASRAFIEQQLKEARRLYIDGQHESAIRATERVLIEDPKNLQAWQIEGSAACYLNEVVRANRAYHHLDAKNRNLLKSVCNRKGISLHGIELPPEQKVQFVREAIGEIVQRCADFRKVSGWVRIRATFSEGKPGRAAISGDRFATEAGDCIRRFIENTFIKGRIRTLTIEHSWNVRSSGIEDMTYSQRLYQNRWLAPLSYAQVERALQAVKPAQRCGFRFPQVAKVTIHPDGRVGRIEEGPGFGFWRAACVRSALSQARFPSFSGAPFSVYYSHDSPYLYDKEYPEVTLQMTRQRSSTTCWPSNLPGCAGRSASSTSR
jgi:hypothetical protein